MFATQSPHKVLAALSQASIILAENSQTQQLDPQRFNEAFMLHTSTSPHYGIIASIDVTSGMLSGAPGRSLVNETLEEALAFRQAMQHVGTRLPADAWWFATWQPTAPGSIPADPADWRLAADDWHGFGALPPDYALLDPCKVTLLTPGLADAGRLAGQGIPAAVVSRFLAERGLVVEKTGLYSFLVLFSLGITKGKWSTLVAELLEFKRLYDANTALSQVLPRLAGHYPDTGLADLCQRLHLFYQRHQLPQRLRALYTELPEMRLRPADAWQAMVRGQVEAVPVDALAGRTSAVMLVPYPPGIPLVMPGEVFPADDPAVSRYLAAAQAQDAEFPGFASDIHGVRHSRSADGQVTWAVDCIRLDAPLG